MLLHVGFYDRNEITDTPRYQDFGDAMMSGQVPYRDFGVEYPPGALPVFVLPSLGAEHNYRSWFEVLMWVCAGLCSRFAGTVLGAGGLPPAPLPWSGLSLRVRSVVARA